MGKSRRFAPGRSRFDSERLHQFAKTYFQEGPIPSCSTRKVPATSYALLILRTRVPAVSRLTKCRQRGHSTMVVRQVANLLTKGSIPSGRSSFRGA